MSRPRMQSGSSLYQDQERISQLLSDGQSPADQPPVADQQPVGSRRLSAGQPFFCRWCKATARGDAPPAGWFRIQQRHPDPSARVSRTFGTLALLCGPSCLVAWATNAQTEPASR